MEEVLTAALFYDGYGARPAPVQVSLAGGLVHLHDPYEGRFIDSYPLNGATHNLIGSKHFIYLNAGGTVYLQLEEDHPLIPQMLEELDGANPGWARKLMQQKLVVLVPLMVLLAAGLYFLLLMLVPFIGLQMINTQSEITLGNKLHQVILHEVSLADGDVDTSGTYRLQAFAKKLQLSKQYPIRLTLVQSNIVNAYALPGGQIVVYTGIVKKIKTPEALAALLAHESTHVNQRHSLRSLLRSSANGLLVSILFGDVTGISGVVTSNAENLTGLRYSRGLETEADEKGMDLLLANGVPLNGMEQLMRTLKQESDIPGFVSFLSTHPLTKERIKAAAAYQRRHPQQVKQRADLKHAFDDLKKAL